jgi:uncharacterized membrane protein YkoI
MRRRLILIAAGIAALAALALGGAAIANATQGDDGAQLTGATLQRASAAALKATGGGNVNESEYDSENGATYELEVTKPNGSTVDVRLDSAYKVVAVEGDSEEQNDGGSGEQNDGDSGR